MGAASRRRARGFHPVPDRLLLGVVQVVAERVAEPEEAGGHPVEAARQGPVLEHAEQQGFLLDRQCYGSRGAGILERLGDLFGAFGPAQLLEQNVAAGPREPDVAAPPPRSVAILMCSVVRSWRGGYVNDRLMTASEVAELLSVPVSWVRESTRSGVIPCVELGRYRRYRHDQVTAWLEACSRPGRPVALRGQRPRG